MRDKLFALILILVATCAAGCGGAAAPPLDLPAPVTGQIDVSPPDAGGKSTITGTAGAVTANNIVLAGNADLTETALLWKISDALINDAHAQTSSLPEICTSVGYSCTIAGSDGSFSMTIDAFVGNSIYVVLVDVHGNEISPRSDFTVPAYQYSLSSSGCTGTSAYGYLVDVKNFSGNPIVLFEGDGETGKQNILQIGSGAGAVRIDLPGCYAKQLAIYPLSADTVLLAMISTSDKIVWSGILNPSGLIGINAFVISEYPLAATFVDNPDELLIAKGSGSNYTIEKIALDTGSASGSLTIPAPPNGDTLNGILGIKVLGPFVDGGYLGAAMSIGVDGSSNQQFYMLFFDAKTFDVFSSSPNERMGYEGVGGGILYPNSARDIADFGIGYDGQSTGLPAMLLISDHGNQWAHKVGLQHSTSDVSFENTTMSELYTDKVNMTYWDSSDMIIPPFTSSPRRLVLGMSSNISMAYLLTDENHLWKLENYPMGVSATQSTWSIPGASDCRAIGLDDPVQSIFVGDTVLGDVIDASGAWGSGS